MNIWHRDLKSANILLTIKNNQRIVKVADLGSARSAMSEELTQDWHKYNLQNQDVSEQQMEEVQQRLDSQQKIEYTDNLSQTFTLQICTPCYQAPELLMSTSGLYTKKVDMWSLGCIFGELIQRIPRTAQADMPKFMATPVFLVEGQVKTPEQRIANYQNQNKVNQIQCDQTLKELQTIFRVIGTPSWASICQIQEQEWRNYIIQLSGKAPSIQRRFGEAGEVAVDLVRRLLMFDPHQRCGSDEALSHEYFNDEASSKQKLDYSQYVSKILLQHQTSNDDFTNTSGLQGSQNQQQQNKKVVQVQDPLLQLQIQKINSLREARNRTSDEKDDLNLVNNVDAQTSGKQNDHTLQNDREQSAQPFSKAQSNLQTQDQKKYYVLYKQAASQGSSNLQAVQGISKDLIDSVIEQQIYQKHQQEQLQQHQQQYQNLPKINEQQQAEQQSRVQSLDPFREGLDSQIIQHNCNNNNFKEQYFPNTQSNKVQIDGVKNSDSFQAQNTCTSQKLYQKNCSKVEHNYYEISHPALALNILEFETQNLGRDEGTQKLRYLIDSECQAQQIQLKIASSSIESVDTEPQPPLGSEDQWKYIFGIDNLEALSRDQDPDQIGRERILKQHNLETTQTHTDAERFLSNNRHSEWLPTDGSAYLKKDGNQWGVSLTPPGVDGKLQSSMINAIKSQQLR